MEGLKDEWLQRVGYLFYVASPNQTSFATAEDVPDFNVQVVPLVVLMIGLEMGISLYKRQWTYGINDGIASLSQGFFQEIMRAVTKGVEYIAYIYVYENYRLLDLPWNSAWTWWLGFLAIDFFFYWLHRAGHEINIFWAVHQVHHSSEYFNFTSAFRQPVAYHWTSWIIYLPLSLAIPPSVYVVHKQLNLLYQIWIHTEIIKTVGPLEYILNTPSHHRVHHGRNRYCIDKNYGGVLIIWDRIFGTFEAENEEVVYGLTHPINTFEPFTIQMCHFIHLWKTFWITKGFVNKLSVIFKGPGWEPGKPWHGHIEDIPDVHAPMAKYDPKIPIWCKAYVALHFLLILLNHMEITERYAFFSKKAAFVSVCYEILSITSFGTLLDGRYFAPWLELVRCLLFFFMDNYYLPSTRIAMLPNTSMLLCRTILRICFLSSAILWFAYSVTTASIQLHIKNRISRKLD